MPVRVVQRSQEEAEYDAAKKKWMDDARSRVQQDRFSRGAQEDKGKEKREVGAFLVDGAPAEKLCDVGWQTPSYADLVVDAGLLAKRLLDSPAGRGNTRSGAARHSLRGIYPGSHHRETGETSTEEPIEVHSHLCFSP